jgi:hypothetical protein
LSARGRYTTRARRGATSLVIRWFDLNGDFVKEDQHTIPYQGADSVVFEVHYEGARVED